MNRIDEKAENYLVGYQKSPHLLAMRLVPIFSKCSGLADETRRNDVIEIIQLMVGEQLPELITEATHLIIRYAKINMVRIKDAGKGTDNSKRTGREHKRQQVIS